MDIIEIRRQGEVFSLPPGDFVLRSDDVLKVRCDVEKLKSLKDRERIAVQSSLIMGDNDLKGTQSTLVELVITVNSDFADKNLREMDFRRSFRAIPLGILHREEMLSENLYEVKLKPGDVILAEVKTHYVEELKKMQQMQSPPFVVLSEDHVKDFDRKRFGVVVGITGLMILLAATGVVNILTGAIGAVLVMVLLGCINMKELYESVNWKIVFLMAGALSFGLALHKTGLDRTIADAMIGQLGIWGPVAVLSGIYLLTSFFTEIMSNTAAAALSTPIAISAALAMNISPTPFLIAVMFAASSSFMTPIGYQTNTMVYGTGHYRFTDFLKVGTPLNLLLWVIASLTIPLVYPF
jgi:di/tricarboxylate transporter